MQCTKEDCNEEGYPRYDRNNCYSGRRCDKHTAELPGQGEMWDYELDHNESLEEPT